MQISDAAPDAAWHVATVARVLGGDVGAYGELVRAHRARCLRYAFRLLGDQDEAEDVAQEAFVRAYRALGRCDDPGRFGAWLFRILMNRCRTALARRARRARRDQLLASEGSWKEAEHGSTERDVPFTLEDVEAELQALPHAQREAFLLRHVEDMSYEDMAELTGSSITALRMRVSRAREHLRARLSEVYDGR